MLQGNEAGENLSRESFVDLNDIRVIRRETGKLFGTCDSMNGTETHTRGIAAGVTIGSKAPERLNTKALSRRFRPNQHSNCTIGFRGAVAGSDRAGDAIKERRQSSKFFRAQIGVDSVILSDRAAVAKHRGNFPIKTPAGSMRFPVRITSEAILRLAADTKLADKPLCCIAHRETSEGISESEFKSIPGLKVREMETSRGGDFLTRGFRAVQLRKMDGGLMREQQGDATRTFHTTNEKKISLTRRDTLVGGSHCL